MGGQWRRGGPASRLAGGVVQRFDRPLGDAQLVHRTHPQKQIHALQDVLGLMLDQQGGGPDDAQLQRACGPATSLGQFLGTADAGQALADDFAPAGLQGAGTAPELAVQILDQLLQRPPGTRRRPGQGPRATARQDFADLFVGGQRAAHFRSIAQGMDAVPLSDTSAQEVGRIRAALLDWYAVHARTLVWRAPPGVETRPDPYRVWLSEVMLQQTTTPHATPYFLAFTARWPTVTDLAAAEDGDVMAAWAGLGYYARARNLLACARAVATDHGGVFPGTEAELLKLPGVGAYTAAAVAAIAFGQPANVVDGNVCLLYTSDAADE